jgi:hypothetical protein
MKIKSVKLSLLLALVAAMAATATAGLWDDFESYLVGTNLTQLSAQGWRASDISVIVASNVLGNTTKLAELPQNTVASNTLQQVLSEKVWTDWLMNESVRLDPVSLPAVNSNAVVMVGVTVNGYAGVYNPASNGWVICSNDVRGTYLGGGVADGAWLRMTVCEDFSSHQMALFLNGRLLCQGIPFITNRTSCAGIRFSSGNIHTGYVDNVYASNAVPSDLASQALSSTNDINGNGTLDILEIMQYGSLARTVPGEYSTITGALAAAQAGERIVVSNAEYAGSITLSNGVMLAGTNMGVNATNLTVNGAMTVGTGTVIVASGQFTVTGQVTVVAGGVLTVSNTAASFGGLATGAGGKVVVDAGSSLAIDGITNGPGTYWTVTNMVYSAGNGTISPVGTNTMLSTWQNVIYSLTANVAYVVGSLTNNSVVTNYPAGFPGMKTATYTNLAANITNNQNITAAFVYTGIRYVPGDYPTITDALAAAAAGERIVMSDGSYAESLVVSNNVTLSGTIATNLTGLTVLSNKTVVLSGFTTFTVSALTIQSGGVLLASNATVTANGRTFTGTFMLDSGWGGALTPPILNFTDDFESYATDMPLALCGGQGWVASDFGSVVQGSVYTQKVKAARMTAFSSLSNVVAGTALQTNVWTDFWINDNAIRYDGAAYPATNSNRAVMLCVNSNSHVVIWNNTAWDECVENAVGGTAPTVASGQWVRVSVFENFTTHMAALFLNGQLVRQQLPFIDNSVNSYHGLSFKSGEGFGYVDDVKIWTTIPTDLMNGSMSDLDGDGIADAVEITSYGSIMLWPRGSVFKIR